MWKRPDNTNGPLIHYQLTFEREEQSISVAVDPTYHYYVIQPSDIPSGSDGPVTVEVSLKELPSIHRVAPLVSETNFIIIIHIVAVHMKNIIIVTTFVAA